MHWNGLLITVVGLIPALWGGYCLRTPSAREECRNASNLAPRIMVSIPGNFGFVLFMLFGLFVIVDGIFYFFAGPFAAAIPSPVVAGAAVLRSSISCRVLGAERSKRPASLCRVAAVIARDNRFSAARQAPCR